MSLKYYKKALEIFHELEDKNGEAKALNCIANIYYSLSDYKNALLYYKGTKHAIKGIDHKPSFEATLLSNIALTYLAQKNIEAAFECSLASLKIYKKINMPVPHSLLNTIGILYQETGDYSASLKYFMLALEEEEEIENIADQSYTLGNIGVSYEYMNDHLNAVLYLSEALLLLKKTGNVQAMASIHTFLGNAHKKLKSYQQAISCYQKSLKYSREINDKSAISNILNEFGELYLDMKDFSTAREYLNESLKIAMDTNDEINMVKSYMCLAMLYIDFKDMARVSDFLEKAIKIAKANNSYRDLSTLYLLYSHAYEFNGNMDEAMDYLDKHNEYKKKSFFLDKAETLRHAARKEYFETHAQIPQEEIWNKIFDNTSNDPNSLFKLIK